MFDNPSFLSQPTKLLKWLPYEAVQIIKSRPSLTAGGPIVYWMSASARTELNYVLEAAYETAIAYNRQLVIIFVIDPKYKDANERSFRFMTEGLLEVQKGLKRRGLLLHIKHVNYVRKYIQIWKQIKQSKQNSCAK